MDVNDSIQCSKGDIIVNWKHTVKIRWFVNAVMFIIYDAVKNK